MLTPALAHAADWDPDTARILGDPTFLPLTGQIYGDFSYGYTAQTYHYNQTPFGGSGESWDKSSNLFAPNVSYGITDDISVSANLNWGNLRSTDRYVVQELVFGGPAPGFLHFVPRQERTTYLSLGADNPVFGATWRAADQRRGPVNVDISLDYAPDVFTARDATPDATGTLARGGQRGTAEIALSREWQVFTLRGYGQLGYGGSRKVDTSYEVFEPGPIGILGFGGHSVTYAQKLGGRPDYELGLQTQTRPLPFFAINAGVSFDWTGDYSVQQNTPYATGGSRTVRPGTDITPYVGLLVPIVPKRVVSEVLYQHDFIGSEKNFYGETGVREFEQNQSNTYTASVRFLFF